MVRGRIRKGTEDLRGDLFVKGNLCVNFLPLVGMTPCQERQFKQLKDPVKGVNIVKNKTI